MFHKINGGVDLRCERYRLSDQSYPSSGGYLIEFGGRYIRWSTWYKAVILIFTSSRSYTGPLFDSSPLLRVLLFPLSSLAMPKPKQN